MLPGRPLSVGELLDSATDLLRSRARSLFALGLLLAVLEQAALFPLWALVPSFHDVVRYDQNPAPVLLWLICGLASETLILGVLGVLASRAALRELGGVPGGFGRPLATAGLVTLVVGGLSLFCGVPWVLGYALLGLAVPAAVIDRSGVFGSLWRSVRLVVAGSLRAGAVRLLGYSAWLLIRIGFAFAAKLLLDQLFDVTGPFAVAGVWALVNALAYPALACLDAVTHVENRMRVEGLDIELGRAPSVGRPVDDVLRVAR